MKINIGCGKKHLQNYINCDRYEEVKPDRIVDLEGKLPFKENSIDEVMGNHILEHIHNFIPLMHELHRVCKNGAVLKFKVPFYLSVGAFSDATHCRFFTPFTFDDFTSEEFAYEFKSEGMFKIKKVKLIYGIGFARRLNWLINPLLNLSHRVYCKLFAGIFPAAEIEFEIEVIKWSKIYYGN